MNTKDRIKKLEKEVRKYKQLSIHDPLTGLYNYRKLKQDLSRYLELQKRHKVNFVVALFDIDGFKLINDTYGHKKGDEALKLLAKVLKGNIRKYEKVYRYYQGDEFILILSHTKNIKPVINRIRKELKRYNIKVSIGYDKLSKEVLDIIDKKMYTEKSKKKS